MGVGTFETYDKGDNVYFADGERMTYSDTGPTGTAPPDPAIIPDLADVVSRLDEMSKDVPVDAPWESPSASDWDGQTLQQWIDANSASPSFRRLVPAATRPIFGAEPREISLLFSLFYIASSGDERNIGTFERNFNTRDGAQMFRFVGGSQLIAQRLARAARLAREARHAGAPDRADPGRRAGGVEAPRDHRAARDRGGAAGAGAADPVRARRCPATRLALERQMPQGTLLKVTAVYDRPFWREKDLNGTAVSLNGPVNACFDDSPPDGAPGALFGFVGGDEARKYRAQSKADRRAAVLKNFADYFGREALNATPLLRHRLAGRPVVARRSGGHRAPGAAARRTARRCASRSGRSTGPAPRRRTTGTATWTAPCAPASGPRAR